MELRIDNVLCDLPKDFKIDWRWESESMQRAEALRSGWSLTIDLPATAHNEALLQQSGRLYAPQRFNHTLHRARISQNEVTLLEGVVRLLDYSITGAVSCYRIELRGGAAEWAKHAATQPLGALPIDFSMRLTPSAICANWSDDSPVKFLPICYDDYRAEQAEGALLPVERILSTDNYHPFLHIETMLRHIFMQAGYRMESRFLTSDFFRSLYMSGAYASVDVAARRKRMDFLAARSCTSEAKADHEGRVWATPNREVNSVGNLVDSWLPGSQDDQGNLLTECFSTNGCFTQEQGAILFRPLSEIEAGFEYRLHYRSDYRILSRRELRGFNSIYLGPNAEFGFVLENRFTDRREELTAGQSYRIVVFDHNNGNSYRLVTADGTPISNFAVRSALVTIPAEQTTPSLELWNNTTQRWEIYTKDWALYDGHVKEYGTTEVDITLRTPAESTAPSSPKFFDQICLFGAEEGMTLQLLKGTTLRPCFTPRPALGELLTWDKVAHLDIRQSELIDAVIHLFDLCIFTDEEQKCVTIEPYGDFYEAEQVCDWSDRLLGGIRIEECDHEVHETRRYGYRTGDGAVERRNRESEAPFGEWEVRHPSKATLAGKKELRNPLFAPTININGYFEGAPSALIPSVGNRDHMEAVEQLSFTPRIVCYAGLKPLAKGERWPSATGGELYPLAAFHFTGDGQTGGFTLCFEDRDGLQGLNRFHRTHEAVRECGRRLHLRLRLTVEELRALQHRSSDETIGMDALFGFYIDREAVRCRLETIESYDPITGIASCRFLQLKENRPW